MANFKTHIVTATVASGIASTALYVMDLLTSVESVVMLGAGIIGGALPDIDSDHSTPLKIAFTLLSIIISFIVMFSQPFGDTVVELIALWIATFMVMRFVVLRLFQSITVHRGIIHSLPVAAIAGLLSVHFIYHYSDQSAYLAWMFGSFITFGFLVHLLLDEFYSVNLLGIEVKKSLGTAFKLYDSSQIGLSLLMYLIAAALFWSAPSPLQFATMIFNAHNWDHFLTMLYPTQGWFTR
ncbi:metal-dependent hydrolase [Ectothiorhodospiraceae bacterium BW-2]|nr:metal-dependent hydrolase [Ectothiorhodospiraceae bacterium BW-2]